MVLRSHHQDTTSPKNHQEYYPFLIPASWFLMLFLLPGTATAQVLCALGSGASSYNAYSDERPSSDALELAGRVNAAMKPVCSPNCPSIALFRNPTAAHAMLIVVSGQAKLIYAAPFFTTVYEKHGDGGIIAIIAHEVAHAIDVTVPAPWIKSDWGPELRADAWAGCALAKTALGVTALREALAALSASPSAAHPAWAVRVTALRLGYTHCGGDGLKFDTATNLSPPRHREHQESQRQK